MTTPLDRWATTWMQIGRDQPAGDWIITGMQAWLVGGMNIETLGHHNDNERG